MTTYTYPHLLQHLGVSTHMVKGMSWSSPGCVVITRVCGDVAQALL
jgi:hypothetical protein